MGCMGGAHTIAVARASDHTKPLDVVACQLIAPITTHIEEQCYK